MSLCEFPGKVCGPQDLLSWIECGAVNTRTVGSIPQMLGVRLDDACGSLPAQDIVSSVRCYLYDNIAGI